MGNLDELIAVAKMSSPSEVRRQRLAVNLYLRCVIKYYNDNKVIICTLKLAQVCIEK